MKFRKKPVIIDAQQFVNDDQARAIRQWVGIENCDIVLNDDKTVSHLKIPTLEGTMTVSRDDWVIRGVAGEYYPCKPDIFDDIFESPDDDDDKDEVKEEAATAAEPKEWIERQDQERRAWAIGSAIEAGTEPGFITDVAEKLVTYVKGPVSVVADPNLHDQDALDTFHLVLTNDVAWEDFGFTPEQIPAVVDALQDDLTDNGVRFKNGKKLEIPVEPTPEPTPVEPTP